MTPSHSPTDPLAAPGSAPATDRNNVCVLADDERVIADTLAMILNQSGFRAFATYSGEECIKVARRERPAFLITDFLMGGIHGIDAAIQIRQFLPECRVLVYSSTGMPEHIHDQARENNLPFDYMRIPMHPQQILEWLRRPA